MTNTPHQADKNVLAAGGASIDREIVTDYQSDVFTSAVTMFRVNDSRTSEFQSSN